MDKKILLQELADIIAVREGLSKKKAETFCRLFFETVEEGLNKDKYVKIKGFGTFKLVPVGERESVNVNTGERIQISGHSKISFTPDALLRDLVNKPFAHFQTVTLNDETDIEELESVPTPQIVEEVEEAEVEVEEAETAETTEASDVKDAPPSEKEAETANVQEETVEDVPEKEAAETVEDIIEVVEETPVEEASASVANPEESVEEPVSDPAAEPQKAEEKVEEPQVYTIEVADDKPEVASNEVAEPEAVEMEKVGDEALDEEEYEEPASRCSIWRWLGIILLIAALMVLSYLAGYYRVFSCGEPGGCEAPSKSEVKVESKTAAPKATASDTTALKKADEGEEKAEADVQNNASVEENTDNQASVAQSSTEVKVHVVKPGESLNSIAKEYYGDKKYAVFIIQNNEFDDPNIIRVGMTVKLPPLPAGAQP